LKENNLINSFIWPIVPSGRAPLDDFLALEKTLINEGLEISFGALAWFPPVSGGGGSLTLLFLPLGGTRLLLAILVVTRCFTRMRLGATMRGGGGGAFGEKDELGDYFLQRK
jgi:hypothetical protein